MLAASATAPPNWGASTFNHSDAQVQDLESLAQRLRALEKLLAPPMPSSQQPGEVAGEQSPTEDTTEDIVSTMSPSRRHHHPHSASSQHTPGSLSRRIKNMESRLWAAAKERKPTEEFLLKYEASNLINSPHGSHSDRELLTLQAKSELILAANDELQKLAEESKEIQSLQRCAEIGGLLNVESQYPVLSKLETVHIEQCQDSNKVSDRMNKLTDDYNGLASINTLSEVFLSWDALLTAAEGKVSEIEKSRN
ncbi:hypothetical protein BGZ83_002868 [Gryganskiella cystojenkinii]|nr:hypothetical protein BGZ83_002868 [Gryganskiella cystojenkinii]